MSCVSLIGMPASGKSTIGVLLAKQLGFSFLDSDILIQTAERAKLRDLIRRNGLDGFCRIEAAHILSIECRRTVIATGGSAVYGKDAMAHLKSLGQIIFLNIPPENLTERIGNLGSRGVVMKSGQTLEDLYKERFPLYRKYADIVVHCAGKSPAALVREIVSQIID